MNDFLTLAFIFLLASAVAVPLSMRFGFGSVLGYLLAGIAISPLLVALSVDIVAIQHFAEFGVVMMLFLVGLELEPRRLWSMRHKLFGLGAAQIALTTIAIAAIAMALGQGWNVALSLGLILSLSSTAIVLQTLGERSSMRGDAAQSSFSVLLFQDVAFIPMLAILPLLALGGGAHVSAEADHQEMGASLIEGLPHWLTALVVIAAIAFIVIAGARLTRPVFRFIAASNMRELFTATALLMLIGTAMLMSSVGLSPALGTFLAGVVLAESEYRHELETEIAPFKSLLLGLFFMTVGASIDFALLFDKFLLVIAMAVSLMVLKAFVLLILTLFFRIRGSDRWLFALGLAQAGEFGFVLLGFSVVNGVITSQMAAELLLVVTISMLLTPLLFILHDRVIAPRFARLQAGEPDEVVEPSNIIIAGYGRVGGMIGRILLAAGYNITAIDNNSEHLEALRAFGFKVYYGDPTRPDLLESAGIADARILIVAINGREDITELVSYAQDRFPKLHIIARALDRNHVYDLYAAGCRDIVRESYDSSLRMGRSAFEAMGIKRERAQKMVDVFDDADRKAMIATAKLYDPEIPMHKNIPYVEKTKQLASEGESALRRKMLRIRDRK